MGPHSPLAGASPSGGAFGTDKSRYQPSGSSSFLITVAGEPAAKTPGGMSLETTEFAPTTERAPIVTPGMTATLRVSHTPSSMTTGPL
jgi:hypothetical protein